MQNIKNKIIKDINISLLLFSLISAFGVMEATKHYDVNGVMIFGPLTFLSMLIFYLPIVVFFIYLIRILLEKFGFLTEFRIVTKLKGIAFPIMLLVSFIIILTPNLIRFAYEDLSDKNSYTEKKVDIKNPTVESLSR